MPNTALFCHAFPALLHHREMAVTVLLLHLYAALLLSAVVSDDTAALFLFRNQTDLDGALLSNWTTAASAGATACAANWRGVHCRNGRVSAVAVRFLGLRGPIDVLAALDQLRVLDLRGNRLNGSVAPIARCLNLQRIELSGNGFSGEIPPEISSLSRVRSLDLSNNNLSGLIPAQIFQLSRLRALRLQNNQISGAIPNSLDSLAHLRKLNLSNNDLHGILPNGLISRFGWSSFSGNQGLCENCSSTVENPPPSPQSVPSSTSIQTPPINEHSKLSNGDIMAISASISILLLTLFLLAVWCYCRNSSSETNPPILHANNEGSNSIDNNGENEGSDHVGNNDENEIILFDRMRLFGLQDLLQASAEMIGKGSVGAVYKAVLDHGFVVAVKRLKDANPCPRYEFEQYMNAIGRLRHPNLIRLKGYYYARDEKLLVYDYMPNGSLHSLLHECRRVGRIPLDWTTRIGLILGAARGLARIHSLTGIPHGNLKSSNVLLDKNGVACVSDFGLSYLLTPSEVLSKLGGYRAPELLKIQKLSLKGDVYSFGVILLEVLTGRDPLGDLTMDLVTWVRRSGGGEMFDLALLRYRNENIEKEMAAMMHLAMVCVETLPERRPEMVDVVGIIEEIRVEESGSGSGSVTPLGSGITDAAAVA